MCKSVNGEERLQFTQHICAVVPSRVGMAELVHNDTTEVHELKKLVTSVHQTLVNHLHSGVCVCVCGMGRAICVYIGRSLQIIIVSYFYPHHTA